MKIACFILPLIIGGLAACNSGSSSDSNQSTKFDGIWSSKAYGKTFRIQGQKIELYQHDSRFCLLEDELSNVTTSDLETIFELNIDGISMTDPGNYGVKEFHAPATLYNKVETLPQVCDSPVLSNWQAGYQRDPQRDFEIFWQTFNDYYLSFNLKGVDWNAIYEQGQASVSSSSSNAELMEVFYQMIAPLTDAHVQITSEILGTASVDGKPTLVERMINEYVENHGLNLPLPVEHLEEVNHYIDEQLALYQAIIQSYADDVDEIRSAANGRLMWFIVDNIAYLQINGMSGFSEDEEDNAAELTALETGLDRFIQDIQFSDGLIIDVRVNNGGRDFLSMAIASRFVDTERVVYSKQARLGNEKTPLREVTIQPRGKLQYLKPVVLLTSNSTVSAAEVFTLMMRSLPQVTLMGESTQGALSDALDKALPNGFQFSLSNEFYYSTEGEWFEHQGIPVDFDIPFFTREQRFDKSDAGLESAYALLSGNL